MSFRRPDGGFEHSVDLFDEDGVRVNEYIDTSTSRTQTRSDFTLKPIFSGVEINYKMMSPIGSITRRTLDDGNLDIYNNADIANDITQLFVDICAQDNADTAQYMDSICKKAGEGLISVNCQNLPRKRMDRFLGAYKFMFGYNLTFYNITDNTTPVFQKGKKQLKIEDLSSGEKQVIFRGASLLKNINNVIGYPVLIDEPELSMHPKWEQKSYNYYKKMFSDSDNMQESQIVFATHSEHVISSALEDDEALIIDSSSMSGDNNHKYRIVSKDYNNNILPSTTIAEIKYQIFHIPSIDYHISLYSYIQENMTRCNRIVKVDKFLQANSAPAYPSSYGDTDYYTLPTYIRNRIDHPKNNEHFTYDQLEESIEYMVNLICSLRNDSQ